MKLITDKDKALIVVRHSRSGQQLKSCSPDLQDNFDVVMEAVQAHGYALQFASERLKNDKAIVKVAVEKNPLAFNHAGSELKKDKDFILKIIQPDITSSEIYRVCDPALQQDKNFIIDLLKKNAFVLKYIPLEMRGEKDIVWPALNQHEYCYSYIKKSLRSDEKIIRRALLISENLQFLPKEKQNDPYTVLIAVENEDKNRPFSAFKHVSSQLRNNKEFMTQVISINHHLFSHASNKLKQDCELLKFVLEKHNIKIDHNYTNSKELLEPVLEKNSYFFCYASNDITNDKVIILKAIKKNINSIHHASKEIKNMLGNNKNEFIQRLEQIVKTEEFADKLDRDLGSNNQKNRLKI